MMSRFSASDAWGKTRSTPRATFCFAVSQGTGWGLEHHSPIRPGVGDLFVQEDPPGRDVIQTRHHRQNGGLAAAGVTDQGDELPFFSFISKPSTTVSGPLGVGYTLSTMENSR